MFAQMHFKHEYSHTLVEWPRNAVHHIPKGIAKSYFVGEAVEIPLPPLGLAVADVVGHVVIACRRR